MVMSTAAHLSELHSPEESAILHSMGESATVSRRERTADAIHDAALALTDERGFDGWTMDQLAETVGVSRRTLFNHVPGKTDAILGPEHEPDEELFATFLAGGPTGDLLADIRGLVVTMTESKSGDRSKLARMRRVFRSDPRLMHAAHSRFERATARFAELIRQREGTDFPTARARLVVRVIVTVFDSALDDYLAHPAGASFADHFTRTYDDLVDLFH